MIKIRVRLGFFYSIISRICLLPQCLKKLNKKLHTAIIRSKFTLYLLESKMELNAQETELILQIRNYKNAKHNPSRTLRMLVVELFYTLLDD
jgi:hypothetical protein